MRGTPARLLGADERRAVLETVLAANAGRGRIIAHIGALDTAGNAIGGRRNRLAWCRTPAGQSYGQHRRDGAAWHPMAHCARYGRKSRKLRTMKSATSTGVVL